MNDIEKAIAHKSGLEPANPSVAASSTESPPVDATGVPPTTTVAAPPPADDGADVDASSNPFLWERLVTGRLVLRDAAGVRVTPGDLAPGGRLASSGASVDAAYEKQVRAPWERAAREHEARHLEAITVFRADNPGQLVPSIAMAEAAYEKQRSELAKQRERDEAVDAWQAESDVPLEYDATATFLAHLLWNCPNGDNEYGVLAHHWGCVPANIAPGLYVIFQQDAFGESAEPYLIVPELRAWMRSSDIKEVGFGVTGGNGLATWTMVVDASDVDVEDPGAMIGAWLDARYAGVVGESYPGPVHGRSVSPRGLGPATASGETAIHSDLMAGGDPVAMLSNSGQAAGPSTARRKGESPTVDEAPRNLEALRKYSQRDLASLARDVGLLATNEAFTAWSSVESEDRARYLLLGLENWDEVVRRAHRTQEAGE